MAIERSTFGRWVVRITAWVVVLAGVGVIGVGVWWATDLPADPSPLDDVAILLGVVTGAFGLVLVVTALVVLRLSRRRLRTSAVVLCALGAFVALVGWATVAVFPLAMYAPLLLGGLTVGAVGFGVCLGSPAVTIDSRSGSTR